MIQDLHTAPEPSITSLVTGIVDDAQELFKQQVLLLKEELKDDVRKTKEVSLSFAFGAGVLLIGALLLGLMLPLLLNWAFPNLALWACFGIVGGVLAAIGGGMIYAVKKRLETEDLLPKQSVEALKENLQWTTPK